MNCPECGMEMELGLLRAESFMGGVKWVKDKSRKSPGKETVSKPDTYGYCYLEGFRCEICHQIIVKY